MSDTIRMQDPNQKVWSYLMSTVEKRPLSESIRKIRKKYGIPLGGYETFARVKGFPGKEKNITTPSLPKQFYQDIEKIVFEKLKLEPIWVETFSYYVCYNDWLPSGSLDLQMHGLIQTVNIQLELNGPHWDKEEKQVFEDGLRHNVQNHPVAILISPYVSKEDILSFVKNQYQREILPMQKYHKNPKVKLGIARRPKESSQELREHIRKNVELGIGKLSDSVKSKFGKKYEQAHILRIRKEIRDEIRKYAK
ncbi:MAG: hypothetical protein WAX38_02435 [Minisyncoccia bacterium]